MPLAQITRPALALTLWDSNGPRQALAGHGTRELLMRAQPDVVQIHAGPTGLAQDAPYVATAVRQVCPRARVWLGVGCDGWLRGWHRGAVARNVVVEKLAGCADLAVVIGAEAVVWNAESEWKIHPDASGDLARELILAVRDRHPLLAQGHTANDHPTFHSDYPWRAWLGPGSPITFALPQVYAAPDGGVQAHRGALERREVTALSSWATAVKHQWARPDVEPDIDDDLDWYPYLQLHQVPTIDTVTVAMERPVAAFWAAPSRMDDAGRLAVLACCELRRRGYIGRGAVSVFQSEMHLVVDGKCGPLTLAALGVA